MATLSKRDEAYSATRRRRPADNFNTLLSGLEGYHTPPMQHASPTFLRRLSRMVSDMTEHRSALTDLSFLALGFGVVLYLSSNQTNAPAQNVLAPPSAVENQEMAVFSDDILDLSAVVSSASLREDKEPLSFIALNELIIAENLDHHVQIVSDDERLGLQFKSRVLFNDSSYNVARSGEPILERLLPGLKRHDGKISIEVHTNGNELLYGSVTSEKVLSTMRAEALMDYLSENGISRKQLSGIGHADSRPVLDEKSAKANELNSRVLLLIEP